MYVYMYAALISAAKMPSPARSHASQACRTARSLQSNALAGCRTVEVQVPTSNAPTRPSSWTAAKQAPPSCQSGVWPSKATHRGPQMRGTTLAWLLRPVSTSHESPPARAIYDAVTRPAPDPGDAGWPPLVRPVWSAVSPTSSLPRAKHTLDF